MINDPFKIKDSLFRASHIKNFNADRTEGDAVFFSYSASWIGKSLRHYTVWLFYGLVLAIFFILIGRAVTLQLFMGHNFVRLAEGNRLKGVIARAPRGIIYDRNGKPLVYNSSLFSLYLHPSSLPQNLIDRQSVLDQIAAIIGTSDWKTDVRLQGQQPLLIGEKLPYDQALKLSALSRTLPAIDVSLEPSRQYLTGLGLSHVIGYVGQLSDQDAKNPDYRNYAYNDVIGKAGLEAQYEKWLKGNNGYQEYETDAVGREIALASSLNPTKGWDIYSTIDLAIQKKLFTALSTISRDYGKTRSAGIVMNPETGAILAAVSLPDYDDNVFSSRLTQDTFQSLITDPNKPLFNRFISGEYPPGSTFKIIMASAALQEKMIDDTFTVLSTGGLHIGNAFFPDWRPAGHGLTNIYHALADSVNTFFYIIGGGDGKNIGGLGVARINKYARLFGLGQPSGVDLPNEADGFVPTEDWKLTTKGERWYLGDTYNISIGQGDITLTPLQMAHYTSILASSGRDTQPHFFGKSEATLPLPQWRNTQVSWLSPETINIVRQGLRDTVTKGSATSLQSVSVAVAGKTGTAQFNKNKTPHSWFTGFAPYNNPELVVTILVEEGGDQGYAVKASRLFLESYFNHW
ncbi:MAG: penicillin-binding protein 2 [Candidatus Komeilibacteria bacterium]